MARKKVLLGVVGVDSGQLVVCDPCYLTSEYKHTTEGDNISTHEIYFHKQSGKLWQYIYTGGKPSRPDVQPFPNTYADVIPEYGKCPNDLIASGEFVKSGIDPMAHVPDGEFSYRGICKLTLRSEKQGGQLNYSLGHAGAGVCFASGDGDGEYPVYAEIENGRVRRVIIDFD